MRSSGRFIGAAWLIAALTLVSRLLGVLREYIFSHYFGTGELLSAFRIAFQAPNLARRLFGEGALSSAMIPVLTRSIQECGEESSRRFVGTLLTVLFAGLCAAVIAIELVIGMWRFAHDDPALQLTGLMMPYMVLICTSAVASGVLNVRGHFSVPAAAPTILNVVMIVALLGGARGLGLGDGHLMKLTCWAVLVAGLIQILATGVALRLAGFFPLFGGTWRDPQLSAVFALMAPMAFGLSAVQINTLMDSLIAYLFVIDEHGERVGTAVLGYAQFLYQLPLGVFGISLATAIFPVLSAKYAAGDRLGMGEVFERGVRTGQFIALPSAVGLAFVATPLVATLYQHGGEFDASSTARVAPALVYYALGIPAYFLQHVVIRAFYALHDSRTPARIAAIMVALNLAANLVLVFVMEERGLALSTSVCATIQVTWLAVRLRKPFPEIPWLRIGGGVGRMALAAAAMALALLAVKIGGEWLHWHKTVRLVSLLVTGVAIYGLAAFALRIDELRAVLRRT